jgi:hypothetical protein
VEYKKDGFGDKMIIWKKYYLFILIFVFLIVGLLFHTESVVYANTPDTYFGEEIKNECVPLDIVLLIDQGEDMVQLDPDNIRISVANWFIGVLGYDYLIFCPHEAHRVSVISFGHDGSPGGTPEIIIDLELTPLNPRSIIGQTGWIDRREYFASRIVPHDLGGRDFVAALSEAAAVLNESRIGRKQIIIMFAGNAGIPCSSNLNLNTCWNTDYAQGMNSTIFKDIKRLLHTELAFSEGTGPYVYVFALENFRDIRKYIQGNDDLQSDIIDVWNTILADNAGSIRLFSDDLQMVDALMEIYQKHNRNDFIQPFQTGDIYVDPFMEFMVIYGYRTNISSPVMVQWVQDNIVYALTGADGDREHFGIIDPPRDAEPSNSLFYYFDGPPAGKWQVDGSQIRLWRFERPASGVTVLHPKDSLGQYFFNNKNYDPDDPHYLTFALFGLDETRYLKEYGDYPAYITGIVLSPNQTTHTLDFYFDSTKRVYVSNQPLPVDQIGIYSWEVDITAPFSAPGSNENFLLNQFQGTYEVIEVLPFTFEFIQPYQDVIPLHGRGLEAWNIEPLDISARLIDLEGEPLLGEEVFASPIDESVVVVVTHVETDQSHVYPLSFSSHDESLMSGTILPEDFDVEGEYLFRIEMVGVPNRLIYRMAPGDVTNSLNRQNTLLTSKSTYLISGGTILLLFLLWIAFLVYLYTEPIKGELCFLSALSSEPFDVIDLTSNKKRFLKMGKKRIIKNTSTIISSFLNEIKISKNSDGTLNLSAFVDTSFEEGLQKKRIRNLGSELQYFDSGRGIFVCYNGAYFEEQSEDWIDKVADKQEELTEEVFKSQEDINIDVVENQKDQIKKVDDKQEQLIEEVLESQEDNNIVVVENQKDQIKKVEDKQEQLIDEVSENQEDLTIEVYDAQDARIEEVADDQEDYE